MYEGYCRGDPLELCYEADRPDLDDLSPEDAAEVLFGELNHDRRPNPAFPALNAGDDVSYRTRSGEAGALAVEVEGFREVWPPPVATDHDRAVYRQKLEAWKEWSSRETKSYSRYGRYRRGVGGVGTGPTSAVSKPPKGSPAKTTAHPALRRPRSGETAKAKGVSPPQNTSEPSEAAATCGPRPAFWRTEECRRTVRGFPSKS